MGEAARSADSQMQQFPSAWDLFVPSVRAIWKNIWTLLGLFAVPFGGLVGAVMLAYVFDRLHVPATPTAIVAIALALAAIASFVVVLPASTLVLLRGVRGERAEIKESVRAVLPFVRRYIVLSVLLLAIYAVSLILLVPYLFALKRFVLAPYYLLDKDLKVGEALRASTAASRRYSNAMWGVVGVTIAFSLVGLIPRIGRPVSIVLSLLYTAAPVVRYTQVLEADEDGAKKLKKSRRGKRHARQSDSQTFADQFGGKSTVD